MGKGLGMVRIDRHSWLASGSGKLHAEAQRKTEARGGKMKTDERGQNLRLVPAFSSTCSPRHRIVLFPSDMPVDGPMQDAFLAMRKEPINHLSRYIAWVPG